MKTKIKPYSFEIKKVLEKFVHDAIILSYEEMYIYEPHIVKLRIIFPYKGRDLEVTHQIDTRLYSHDTEWDVVFFDIFNGRKKGEDAELRMFKLLQFWKTKHIHGVYEVYRGSEYQDDIVKADLIVIINQTITAYESLQKKAERSMVCLQIKSSEYYQDIHKQKYPWEASIVVNDEKTDEMLWKSFAIISSTSIIILQMNTLMALLQDIDQRSMQRIKPMRDQYRTDLHQ